MSHLADTRRLAQALGLRRGGWFCQQHPRAARSTASLTSPPKNREAVERVRVAAHSKIVRRAHQPAGEIKAVWTRGPSLERGQHRRRAWRDGFGGPEEVAVFENAGGARVFRSLGDDADIP